MHQNCFAKLLRDSSKVARAYRAETALCLLFPDYSVRNRVLSHLIEKQSGLVYTMRPLDVSQLRLKPMRELIDMVLARIEQFKTQDSESANKIGL